MDYPITHKAEKDKADADEGEDDTGKHGGAGAAMAVGGADVQFCSGGIGKMGVRDFGYLLASLLTIVAVPSSTSGEERAHDSLQGGPAHAI